MGIRIRIPEQTNIFSYLPLRFSLQTSSVFHKRYRRQNVRILKLTICLYLVRELRMQYSVSLRGAVLYYVQGLFLYHIELLLCVKVCILAPHRSKCDLPFNYYSRPVFLNFVKICVSCFIRYKLQTDRLNLSVTTLFYSVGAQTEGHALISM